MAAIAALSCIPADLPVQIATDSQLLLNGITKWITKWKRNNWQSAEDKTIKNIDLWQQLDTAVQGRTVKWEWTRGHADHTDKCRCDELATAAILIAKAIQSLAA